MTLKADIQALLEDDIIPLLHDEVWPDVYAVVESTPVSDGAGGFTTTDTTVESGVCYLKAINRQGQEREVADRLGWSSGYSIDLPLDTVLTPTHTLVVNGRAMDVGEVIRGGEFAYKAVAVVQENG